MSAKERKEQMMRDIHESLVPFYTLESGLWADMSEGFVKKLSEIELGQLRTVVLYRRNKLPTVELPQTAADEVLLKYRVSLTNGGGALMLPAGSAKEAVSKWRVDMLRKGIMFLTDFIEPTLHVKVRTPTGAVLILSTDVGGAE